MSFHEELLAQTQDERNYLLGAPIIADVFARRFERPAYVAFLTEAYHHVRHTVPLMMACGARLPTRLQHLRGALREYINEEFGHEAWILDDIRAAGGDADAARNAQPKPATELMIAYVYDYIARHNPVGFFGMVQVLEGTSIALATQVADIIQDQLALPDEAFVYLRSHGDLDQGHIRFYQSLVDSLDHEEDRNAVLHVAKRVYMLYGDVLRAVPRSGGAAEGTRSSGGAAEGTTSSGGANENAMATGTRPAIVASN